MFTMRHDCRASGKMRIAGPGMSTATDRLCLWPT
ncbi:hypothetical protein R2601_03813 [Salipiger bermudensis HTCC2601]|uniref:Uncharacterized protein n=1 Tax=Salipiger bermudensis (strain DSM 26914 / JCM 13377 / KCTC 12554 / HTCC2601) TaxID=314265 RepID=Q0FW83_SALBH|nr:hypothetical protein R2601_03813 [Salipiger bermudensis HTCC2601]